MTEDLEEILIIDPTLHHIYTTLGVSSGSWCKTSSYSWLNEAVDRFRGEIRRETGPSALGKMARVRNIYRDKHREQRKLRGRTTNWRGSEDRIEGVLKHRPSYWAYVISLPLSQPSPSPLLNLTRAKLSNKLLLIYRVRTSNLRNETLFRLYTSTPSKLLS